MSLDAFLHNQRKRLIAKWREVLVGSYPEQTRRFLNKEKSPFANPVGHVIARDMEILYDELVGAGDRDRMAASLENIIRIRAVQDFLPSDAVRFVLDLKALVREALEGRARNGLSHELQDFDQRVDRVALLAFDIYMQCRHKLYEARVQEVRREVGGLLRRAKLIQEIPEA